MATLTSTWSRTSVGAGLGFAIAFLGATITSLALQFGLIDDGLIFFRFAENIVGGHGLRFNPSGPTVEGFSSPAWLTLLTVASFAGMELTTAAKGLGLACVGLSGGLIAMSRFDRGRTKALAGIVGATVIGLMPGVAFYATSGLETTLFVLSTTAIAVLLCAEHLRVGFLAVVVGLSTWVRPEGFVVFYPWTVAALWVLSEDRRRRSERIAHFSYIVVSFAIAQALWRWFLFGRLLPNTADAKLGLSLAQRVPNGVEYVVGNLPGYWPWLALLILGGLVAVLRADRRSIVLATGGGIWIAYVVAVGGDHMVLGRFLLPVVPLALLALLRLVELERRVTLPVLLLGAGFAVASVWFGSVVSGHVAGAQKETALASSWGKVGRWLRDHESPGTRIAVIPAGALAYFSGFETLDLVGLVTPEVARHGELHLPGKPGHQRFNTDALWDFAPDLIIYTTSGRFSSPQWETEEQIGESYSFALKHAVRDPRVRSCYRYEAYELEDGTWVEVQRRTCPTPTS